jgi:hypothetical protein
MAPTGIDLPLAAAAAISTGPGPGVLGDPPADLAARPLPVRRFEIPWFRSHAREFGAIYFGRSGANRFDAPAREFGVMYLGRDLHCAFIETFGRAVGEQRVHMDQLRRRAMSRIEAPRALQLVDLTGRGLARIGADARLAAGDYPAPQRWALALHEHPDAPDGIYYRSRLDPSRRCAAVFERAGAGLVELPLGSLGDPGHEAQLGELLDHYQFALLED